MTYVVDQSKQCVQIYLLKNCMLPKLQLPILFFVKSIISDMHHRKTYMYINFQPNRVCRSVITVHTNLFTKIRSVKFICIFFNCINLQLSIRISKNHAFRTSTTPSRTFRPILRSIVLLDNELPRKEIISTDDRRTDRMCCLRYDNNR